MTEKNKELLLRDLCARLLYGVKVDIDFNHSTKELNCALLQDCIVSERSLRPYLRPMSSMTEKEKHDCIAFARTRAIKGIYPLVNFNIPNPNFVDWLNAHHFDYRDLIEKGLALAALEGMYKID